MKSGRSVSQIFDLPIEDIDARESTYLNPVIPANVESNPPNLENPLAPKPISEETISAGSQVEETEWVKLCKRKSFKIGGITGAIGATFTYCLGYGLSSSFNLSSAAPIVAMLTGAIPSGFTFCAFTVAKSPEMRRALGSFVISGGVTDIINSIGGIFQRDSYPLLIPIVTLNVVAGTYMLTPSACLGISRLGEKISNTVSNGSKNITNKISNSFFSFWHRDQTNNNLEMTPLNELIDERNMFSRAIR